jgi:hypothetical protein
MVNKVFENRLTGTAMQIKNYQLTEIYNLNNVGALDVFDKSYNDHFFLGVFRDRDSFFSGRCFLQPLKQTVTEDWHLRLSVDQHLWRFHIQQNLAKT